ncbi:cupin-like domain-containing protein [Aestuariibacter halophilus]|uniref:Cupin-like domain-containing protein n=1 Tax=Fluctibacter halophilus TaxID=226011 RepID=A0ABS8GBT1_9ALTE|nr:cupin-like domain-containing protein [Aestuariibacter halophilus]MCC2618032.1 cupin-like domain-containing protein [Aestuariibacter halophilus]
MPQPVPRISLDDPQALLSVLQQQSGPVVLEQLVADWPMVSAARDSDAALLDYLRRFDVGKMVKAFGGDASMQGRYFYNDDMSGFNFNSVSLPFTDVLERLGRAPEEDEPAHFYVGSTTLDSCLPGIRDNNDVALTTTNPLVSLWLGNQSRIACHFDAPSNLACCVAGQRRFTLFPPEQIANLYPGPVHLTPAGQTISLVDFHAPDLERFPRFEEALKHGLIADLSPGDALYVPSMWWHHVEGLSTVNGLINYWWRDEPAYLGQPMAALEHALLSLRQLPASQRQSWLALFDYYIFADNDLATAHLPDHLLGPLGDMDERQARTLRAMLLNRLNR